MVSIGTTNTLGKILKDQKAGRGEKEIIHKKLQLKLPVTRLALSSLRGLHRLNSLSHKLRDGLKPVVLIYVKLEVTSCLSLLSRSLNGFLIGLPSFQSGTSLQPDSRYTKRKSYFQCFTFDFFSMVVMKPDLLLKQYHPKSPVSLGALWTVCTRLSARADLYNHWMKRKSEAVVKSCTINDNTFCGWLIHCGICLGDHDGISSGQKGRPSGQGTDCPAHPTDPSRWGPPGKSSPSATIFVTNPSGARHFLLSTDLSGADGPSGDDELVDAPSEDELLDEQLEEELEEVPSEVEIELVEATLAPGWDEDGAKQGLPCVPSASSSSGDLMQGYVTSSSRLRILGVEEYSQLDHDGVRAQLKKRWDAAHHLTINKGWKAWEFRMSALHLGAGKPFRDVLTR
ncbi:LOW QUALITY PROTEIN: hypothetical protein Cgig2_025022 [Carnegiea gigantea]|uniref:Uncharacterized protein n=1 Tax=Carnegiea gigantea TaxID=171969 RepID=A0A9Q1QAT8_9CARY|nr:LOW QUALITY PROTEIN: hypothetical protein Cgig2_025022 [Carnegiea gigantea]